MLWHKLKYATRLKFVQPCKLVIACCASILVFNAPLLAKEAALEGRNDPEFVKAVEDWLAGKDYEALKKLSELAKGSNTAAQILLASIATRVNMHVHVCPSSDNLGQLSVF